MTADFWTESSKMIDAAFEEGKRTATDDLTTRLRNLADYYGYRTATEAADAIDALRAERDSLRLDRDASEHMRLKDNEHLLARAEQAEAERDELRQRSLVMTMHDGATLWAEMEARVAQLTEALRKCVYALDAHKDWCGYNADAPGSKTFVDACRAAADALRPPSVATLPGDQPTGDGNQ
jgi:hypothetical protein